MDIETSPHWPLKAKAILLFPLPLAFEVLFDYLKSQGVEIFHHGHNIKKVHYR